MPRVPFRLGHPAACESSIRHGGDALRDIAPYARVAFAQGWAASGGPMTEQVKAGCLAAIELAVEHADQPDILEVTLHLGHLEGTWATVYDRREKLYAHHIKAVTDLWRRAAQRLDLTLAIRRYRQSLGLAEADGDTDRRRLIAQTIAATVLAFIAGSDSPADDRNALIGAIANALKAAQAEGWAGAVAIGAEQAGIAGAADVGVIGINFDLAFKDAWNALGDLGNQWADATGWLGRIVDGAAKDLGGRLSALAADGASFEDMLAGAQDVLDSADVRAVSAIVDLAMGQSFSRGALALYGREGVQTVDFITAGARVCPVCLDIESKNPWQRNEVPVPPRHSRCRCNLQAANPMEAAGLFSRYAIGGA